MPSGSLIVKVCLLFWGQYRVDRVGQLKHDGLGLFLDGVCGDIEKDTCPGLAGREGDGSIGEREIFILLRGSAGGSAVHCHGLVGGFRELHPYTRRQSAFETRARITRKSYRGQSISGLGSKGWGYKDSAGHNSGNQKTAT